jgi:hypothetical protein
MLVGHLAVALGARTAEPRVPLGAAVAAAFGVWLYLGSTTPRDATGHWALVALVAVTGLIWVTQPWSPAPPSAMAVAWRALILWLLPPWARWIEAHRTSKVLAVRHG